jgi:hypothetical protein
MFFEVLVGSFDELTVDERGTSAYEEDQAGTSGNRPGFDKDSWSKLDNQAKFTSGIGGVQFTSEMDQAPSEVPQKPENRRTHCYSGPTGFRACKIF